MLFNVGFKEAMKDSVWDCVIFHDVDHLPENDRNYYGCGEMPRHFAAKLDKYMYMWVTAVFLIRYNMFALSHVQLCAIPWAVARQVLLSMKFFRQEYWSVLPGPPPGDLPDPGTEPTISCLCRQVLYHLSHLGDQIRCNIPAKLYH